KAQGAIEDLSVYNRWFGDQWSGKIAFQGDKERGQKLSINGFVENLKIPNVVIEKLNVAADYEITEKSGHGKIELTGFKAWGAQITQSTLMLNLNSGKGTIEFKGMNKGLAPWSSHAQGEVTLQDQAILKLNV